MSKTIRKGKWDLILNFVRVFSASHGFGPTMREIADAVGLRSTSTVADYLLRMQKAGVVTSIPGSARSIRVLDPDKSSDTINNGDTVLQCRFNCPDGSIPKEVYLVVGERGSDRTLHCPGEILTCLASQQYGTEKVRL